MDIHDSTRLAKIFKGLGHPTRIFLLQGVREGRSMQQIAEELDVTRGTVQDHMERLVQADLLYRPDQGERTYALTPIGEFLLKHLEGEFEELLEALETVESAAKEIQERFEEADLPLDERAVEKSVHSEKWRAVFDEIEALLDG